MLQEIASLPSNELISNLILKWAWNCHFSAQKSIEYIILKTEVLSVEPSLVGQFLVAFPHMFWTTMFDPLVFIPLVPGVGGIVAHSQTAAYHPTFFMIMAMADKVLADWQIMHTKQGMRFDKEAIFVNERGEAGFCSRTKENSYWGNQMLPPFDRYAVIPSLQVFDILSWIRVGVG